MDETPQEPASPQPLSRQPGPAPQVVVQQAAGNLFLRGFAFLGWAGFLFCGIWAVGQLIALGQYFDRSGGISEKYHSGRRFASEKVAIIHISGVIMAGDGYVQRQIERVRDDDSIKAVVVRVESPGGTITGSDFIFHHLNKLREDRELPLVVSMGSIAASGGYYVAMAVGDQPDSIFAEPTTTTGSIGVIIPHYDLTSLMDEVGVKDDSIATHPRKQMLSMTRKITDDHRVVIEAYLDEAFVRFKDIVKMGRPAFRDGPEQLEELATGQIFTANQALKNGLVDKIGFVDAALERAAELADIDLDSIRVVEFEQPTSFFGISGLGSAHSSPTHRLSELLELSTPRAYYLFTSLPPLVATWAGRE
jgi:protease-4